MDPIFLGVINFINFQAQGTAQTVSGNLSFLLTMLTYVNHVDSRVFGWEIFMFLAQEIYFQGICLQDYDTLGDLGVESEVG